MHKLKPIIMLLLAAGLSFGAHAQTSTGSVEGLVTDSSGGIIPGADVTITNTGTTDVRKVKTNGSGAFSFNSLPPATYKINVVSPGFKQFQQTPFKLDVASTVSVPVKLEVGASTETVQVTAADPALATQSSSLAYELETKSIEDLPTNGRNPYGFAALVPGVNAPPAFSQLSVGMYSEQFVSINGSRNNQSSFQLDGGDNSNSAFNGPTFYPSVDAVQEYKVQVNNFSAEFGESSGGVVNVITKSGTKDFHGSAFVFARNNVFDANNYFANQAHIPIGPYHYNQFGGSLGGPLTIPHLGIRRDDRTFFFLSYEGLRFTQSVTATATVPTALQRMGDFSQTLDANGKPVVIYDPATTRPDPNSPGNFIRDPFPEDKIDPTRFDAVSKNILPYFPEANTPGTGPADVNNFVSVNAANTTKNTGSLRVDHVISDKQRIFGRYGQNLTIFKRPNPYAGTMAAVAAPTLGDDRLMEYQHVLDYTNALRPNLVMELNSSYNRYSLNRTPPGYGFDPTQLGFPSSYTALASSQHLASCFPQIDTNNGLNYSLGQIGVGGGALIGVCGNLDNTVEAYQEVANFTKVAGRHNIKFGAVWQVDQNFGKNNVDADGVYGFRTDRTQGPNPYNFSSTAGSAFASFLLGDGNFGSIGSGSPPSFITTKHYGGYVQDDWRITTKLTLNLGLRYDINKPYTERDNRLTQVDLTSPSPLQVPGLNLVGGFSFPGVNGNPRYLSDTHNDEVVPRVGAAYSLNAKTVIRGGFGMFYGPVVGSTTPSDGYSTRTSWVTSLDSVHPVNPLSNAFPTGFSTPTGSSLGLLTLVGQGGTGVDKSQAVTVAKQWNFGFQRALPGTIIVDLAYAGSQGSNLYNYTLLDQLPDKYLSLGNALNDQVPNPFYNPNAVGLFSSPTVSREQLLLPYPQFTYFNSNLSNGSSIYHALQLSVNRRFNQGLSFQGSYTYSKGLDDVGGPVQDFYNLRAEKAVFSNNLTHNASISAVWELPFGKKKAYFNRGLLASVFGNFQYNAIATYQSGYPLSIGVGTNTLNNNGPAQRASYVPGVNPVLHGPIQSRLSRYYNIDAFQAPGQFTYGNTPRYLSNLTAPGVDNYDMSIFKNVLLRDNMKIEFRFEAFNIFNRVQFAPPDTTTGNSTAGVISSQINQPRDLQLAARFTF